MGMPRRKTPSESVPKPMQAMFDSFTELTNEFSKKHLNEEYAALLRKLVAALCRKRPSPLLQGRISTWVAGMIHALGTINFLSDKSQDPYLAPAAIAEYFGIGQSTMANKSRQIREMMKISHWSSDWMLSERIEKSPIVWMISVNGFVVDARRLPRQIQEEAFAKGLIPYIPEEGAGVSF